LRSTNNQASGEDLPLDIFGEGIFFGQLRFAAGGFGGGAGEETKLLEKIYRVEGWMR
jgi:hypothetical protein